LYARKNAEFYTKRETVLRARKLACPTTWNPDHPHYYRVLKLALFVLKKYHEIKIDQNVL